MSDVANDLIAEATLRVQQLQVAAEQSAGQHNMNLGRLFEAKERLSQLQNPVPATEGATEVAAEAAPVEAEVEAESVA